MKFSKSWVLAVVAAAVAAGGYYFWRYYDASALPEGIVAGNGRIEAVEIDISTRTPGRIKEILAAEGAFVEEGQILARMDTAQMEAQRRQLEAQLKRATIGIETAHALVRQRTSEEAAAQAVVAQRMAQLDAVGSKLIRSEQLASSGNLSQQVLDNDRAASLEATAALNAARAQLAATDAGISAAQAQVVDAEAAVDAAKAAIESIEADINDAVLAAPRTGRVQYRVAQPGEVLAGGGRVLNLVDVGDVYMTFFLPTAQAGRIAMGTEVRILLDAAPQYVIPAKVSFVSDVAQFTPKTVETEEERQKLMFRVKAQISPELLRKYIQYVKTGLPGVAYIKLDSAAEWPSTLKQVVQP